MAGSTTDLLLGFTKERENMPTWGNISGTASKTYEGAIPTQDVIDFMDYPLVEGRVSADVLTDLNGEPFAGTFYAPDRKAIVRADTGEVFGIFKQGYRIHQPKDWLVNNLEVLLDDGLQIGQARLIKGGAVALVQVELPDTRTVGDVEYRPYLTAVTSHDGSLATTYFTGNIVLVCENQLGIATGQAKAGGSLLKVRHSSGSLGRVIEARNHLNLVVEQVGDDFAAEVEKLMNEHVSDQVWHEFTHALTGMDKKQGRSLALAERQVGVLNDMWFSDERVTPWRNSAWGVVSAVNTAQHHAFTVHGDRDERNTMRTIEGKWEALDAKTLRILEEVR